MNGILAQLNSNGPTWDIFIILFFVVTALIYGMTIGRNRVLVILVSMYMALGVVTYAPFLNDIKTIHFGIDKFFIFKISTFVGMFLLLFFFVSRQALLHTIATSQHPGSWWQIALFSILHVGLLVTIVLSFLPADMASQLTPLTRSIFMAELPRFGWVVAPIVAMVLMKGRGGE